MANQDVPIRSLAGAHAVEEILDVQGNLIAIRTGALRISTSFGRREDYLSAYGEATFGAIDFNASSSSSRGEHTLIGCIPTARISQKNMNRIWSRTAIFVVENTSRSSCSLRNILPDKHVRGVNEMGEEISDHAAPEIKEGPEIEELLRIPFAPSGRPEEAPPIEPRGLSSPGIGCSA